MNRSALCSALMLPLITVLEAPPPKSRTPVDDDTEEELDENQDSDRKVSAVDMVASGGIMATGFHKKTWM